LIALVQTGTVRRHRLRANACANGRSLRSVSGKTAVSHELACVRGMDWQADRLSASAAALEKRRKATTNTALLCILSSA